MKETMNKADEMLVQARAVWMEAKGRADKAQEAARVAENKANQRFAEYVEIGNPGFGRFFRRILKRQP